LDCSQWKYVVHIAILCIMFFYLVGFFICNFFFFSSRRRHTRFDCDWSSDVCSSDLARDRSRLPPSAAASPSFPTISAIRPLKSAKMFIAMRSGDAVAPAATGREIGARPSRNPAHGQTTGGEIGRASCRERVWMVVVA